MEDVSTVCIFLSHGCMWRSLCLEHLVLVPVQLVLVQLVNVQLRLYECDDRSAHLAHLTLTHLGRPLP